MALFPARTGLIRDDGQRGELSIGGNDAATSSSQAPLLSTMIFANTRFGQATKAHGPRGRKKRDVITPEGLGGGKFFKPWTKNSNQFDNSALVSDSVKGSSGLGAPTRLEKVGVDFPIGPTNG